MSEQKPPHSPEQPQFIYDFRFTKERVEALKGLAELGDNKVMITDYVGTDEVGDAVKHYIEYEDKETEKKVTTLASFSWSHLPPERLAQLEEVGLSPYNLDAHTDPILGKIQDDKSEEPTKEIRNLIEEASNRAATQSAERVAAEVVGRLTGRRQRPSSSQQEKKAEPELEVIPENFKKRVDFKRHAPKASSGHKNEKGPIEGKEAVTRERLSKLLPIAKEVEAAIHKKGELEAEKIAEEVKEEAELATQEKREPKKERPNPYNPEKKVEHTWVTRRRKLTPFDRVPKARKSHTFECVQGWLLARTASIMDKRPVVQEVLLGRDGNLYAYATSEQRYIEKLMKGPLSRQEIKDAGQDVVVPWHTQLSNLPLPPNTQYDAKTDPKPKNFYKVEPSKYPLPGISGTGHIFAEPDAIQRGLEDLVIEMELPLFEAST